MLDSLTFEITDSGVEVGIFNPDEEDKADGHNNFSGNSKLPTRRFIPDSSESFNGRIESGINQILNRFREDRDPFDFFSDALTLGTVLTGTEDLDINDVIRDLNGDLFE